MAWRFTNVHALCLRDNLAHWLISTQADACMTSAQPPIWLFVEILDHYLAHLEAGNPLITPKYIAGLVALITEHVETMEAGEAREAVERHYANTRALIKARGVIELD